MELKLNKMKNTTTTGVKTLFIASAMMLSILTLDAQVQIGTDINGEAAFDRSGHSVSMPDANTVAIGGPYNDGGGNDAGHARVYTWNGTAWVQKGLDIDGEAAYDWSGGSVSMPDANTLAIGATLNDGGGSGSGHVRVYTWSGTAWVQKGVDIDGEAAEDISGWSVSMPDANTLAIGAPYNDGGGNDAGHVRVYTWSGTAWIQKGVDIDGEAAGDLSATVSMPDANTLAIGAPNNDGGAGHVRVYTWSGTAWIQKGVDIDGEAAGDNSGFSVSMPDTNTIAIGTPVKGSGNYEGHVRAYTWSGTAWIQKGVGIDGEAGYDFLGVSVSMPDANTLAIGATGNDGGGSEAGHVRVYTWNGTAWAQKGADIDGEAAGDGSGHSVSMPDANTHAIGALNNDGGGNDAGHVRVYTWSGTAWAQKGADIDGEAAGDLSGSSVSMPDANTLAIGAPNNDGTDTNAGHVRVYTWSGTAWVQKGVDIDGEAADDGSGNSVSMPDANTLAIGAPNNYGTDTRAGHVRVSTWSGTAWAPKGADIDGEAANDWSGLSVSMPDANTLASGAQVNDGGGNEAGHVRVYSLATVDVSENSLAAPLELYPNPASSILNVVVDIENLNSAYSIFDNTGRVALTGKLQSEVTSIQLGDLPSGVYTISIGDEIRQTFQVNRE